MNKMLRTVIAACGFVAAITAPLNAKAAQTTTIVSGKGATVNATGYGGTTGSLFFQIEGFEFMSKIGSAKANTSGANAYGSYYDGAMYYYYFTGAVATVDFKATGSLPSAISLKGSIPGTWYRCFWYCEVYSTESLEVNIDAVAARSQANHQWGQTHSDNGAFKVDDKYDNSSAPATFGNSSIISPSFGAVTPTAGSVGQNKVRNRTVTTLTE